MFRVDGRISWPIVSSVVFSTIAILVMDYGWRVITISYWAVATLGIAILLFGNAAIFIIATRSRSSAVHSIDQTIKNTGDPAELDYGPSEPSRGSLSAPIKHPLHENT